VLEAQSRTNTSLIVEGMDGACILQREALGDRAHALKSQIEGHIGSEQSLARFAERPRSCASRHLQTRQESARAG